MAKTKKKKKAIAKKRKPAAKKAIKKKPIKKKAVKKSAVKKAKVKKPVTKNRIAQKAGKSAKKAPRKPKKGFLGEITHYFPKVSAAVIKLNEPVAVGDKIRIKGHTSDFTQKVTSMQIDRVPITAGKKGDEIGLQVESRVRRGDQVTKC